jgi:hypothetical protein
VTSVRGIQFIPSVLNPVDQNGWKPWARQTTLPEMSNFVIAYQGDDSKLLMSNFNPAEDIAWLPSNLPTEGGSAAAAPETVLLEVPRLETSRLDVPILSATPQGGAASTTGSFFVTNTPIPPTGG